MALVKVGSREPGFNQMYNRFAECFEHPVPLNEERRLNKLLRPWIDKGREVVKKKKLHTKFDGPNYYKGTVEAIRKIKQEQYERVQFYYTDKG